MQRIKKLSPHEAQKIAAGEVIDRPANVVKELIENAIDAGATSIAVYIQDGGKKLMKVVDNGYGMSEEDAHLCFDHHATSKISNIHDLETLETFGFRGEALSSIASVSKITLITKEETAQQGIKLELEQNIIKQEQSVTCNTGTDITVQDIFYTIPARKKFLKSRDIECRQIIRLMQSFCLAYLNIHFKLFSEGKQVFNCPPTQSLIPRIAQLWDHKIAQNMVELIDAKQSALSITGAVSNHYYSRYDRNTIFFFVNKRWIKNYHLAKALLKGYLNVLPPARYPAACIFITIDLSQVDINIHPRKEEVKFLHPRIVETTLYNNVKKTLESHLSQQLKKDVHLADTKQEEPLYPTKDFFVSQSLTPLSPDTFDFNTPPFNDNKLSNSIASSTTPVQSQKSLSNNTAHIPLNAEEKKDDKQQITDKQELIAASSLAAEQHYALIGQYKKTYLLLEKKEGLFLIDQHAAHERILYELFTQRFADVPTINLLFPCIVTLSQEEIRLIEPHLNIFQRNGITIELFGNNQLIIQATPVHIKDISLGDLVRQVIGWITEHNHLEEQQFVKTIHEKMHTQIACKAAVKAGDTLTSEQMYQLLEDLYKTANRFTCPHGRPTGWLLDNHEIEKKFKRNYRSASNNDN